MWLEEPWSTAQCYDTGGIKACLAHPWLHGDGMPQVPCVRACRPDLFFLSLALNGKDQMHFAAGFVHFLVDLHHVVLIHHLQDGGQLLFRRDRVHG